MAYEAALAGASALAAPWKRIAKTAKRMENEMNRMTMKKKFYCD